MKKLAGLLFALFVIFGSALGQSQAPQRVLVLPFDSSRSFEPYGLGLATGLQRTLNSLDGVYAPAVAEGGLYVTRAHEAGLDAIATAVAAFEADLVVSGGVNGSGSLLEVTVVFNGPILAEAEQIRLQLPSDPAQAVEGVILAVIQRLGRNDSASQATVRNLAGETPELASLSAVSRASSRLGTNLGEMTAAAGLNPESSWVLAEQARALALDGRTEHSLAAAVGAVAANPEDAEAAAVLGVVADAAGQDEQARASFQNALALNAHHALALTGLAGLTEDRAESTDLLERAVAASPRQVEAVLRLAELETSHQRALQRLRRASSNLPESVALHRAFIERAVAAGDPAGALSYLRQVTSQVMSSSPALYAQATALPDQLAEQALSLVREGREKYPESSGLQLTEAELLREAGRIDEAVTVLEDLYERFPESVEVANSLAVALASDGDVERAREVFAAAADDSQVAQINLGRLLLQAGQARAAIATLEPLVEQNQRDAELFTLYGIALGRTGRIDEAQSALSRALEIDPESRPAARARDLLEQQRRIVGDDAIAFEGEAAAAFEQGLYGLETESPSEAASSFARAFELSDHPLAAFYHGYALHRAGRPRDAISPYRLALEAYPQSDTVLNNLGYAQLQLGRLDLALDLLRRAVAANSENPNAHVNLGLTFFGLGRYGEALESWERAVSLDPGLQDDLADIRRRAEDRR
ncbi:MAG: tetratricopeptide repeat protein [Trueperaceae bacterium]